MQMVRLTDGNPLKKYISFFIPILLTNIVNQSYTYIDTIIIGRSLGYTALATIGTTNNIMFFVNGVISGFATGVALVTAKFVGINQKDNVRHSIMSSVIIEVVITLLFSIFGLLFTNSLLDCLGTPSEFIRLAAVYLKIIFAGIVLSGLSQVVTSLWIATGDTKSSMFFNIINGLVKILITYAFVVKLRLGIAGAALSTITVNGIAVCIKIIYSLKTKPEFRLNISDFSKEIKFWTEHFIVGLSLALQSSVTGIGKIIFQSALNSFSAYHIAAYTAAVNVENVLHNITSCFSSSAATFIAQNHGANKPDRVKFAIRLSLALNVGFAMLYSLIVYAFAPTLTGLFIDKESYEYVIPYAVYYAKTVCKFYLFAALLISVRHSLQGLGYAVTTILGGIAELGVNIFIALFLVKKIGFSGIALSCPISWILAVTPLSILLIILYRKINNKNTEASDYGS